MKTLGLLLAAGGALVALGPGVPTRAASPLSAIVLSSGLRNSMSARWLEYNRHWDELADVNTLTQMLGTGKPTQREYLGCLLGEVSRDTLWIRGWAVAANLKQLQFAVAGDCDHVTGLVGTWHTHPYRADLQNRPIKDRQLSDGDLATFAAGRDLVVLVVWDVDSLDAAARWPDGSLWHPAPLLVR